MHEFLRRLAIHGGLTAILLGIVGVVLADMAASSELTPTGARTPSARSPEDLAAAEKSAASLRTTIPLAMAVWGFVFVALFEGIRRYLWPRRTPTPAAATQPDDTEKLLEELLSQAEAKSALAPLEESSATVESGEATAPR